MSIADPAVPNELFGSAIVSRRVPRAPRGLAVCLLLLLGACGSTLPSPTASASDAGPTVPPSSPAAPSSGPAALVVNQTFAGPGLFIEGAYAYVELRDSSGALVGHVDAIDYHVDQEVGRFSIDAGHYELRSFVRPCDANCGILDPPMAACTAALDVNAGEQRSVVVRRTINSCEITSV